MGGVLGRGIGLQGEEKEGEGEETWAGFWVGLKERKGRDKGFPFSFEIEPNEFSSNLNSR